MNIHLLAPKDKSKWHEVWHHCYEGIQKLPYQHKIWTDEEVNYELELDYKEFYEEYLTKLPYIYSLDYIRYILLEKYRGAYLDIDIQVNIDFFPLLNFEKVYIMEGTIGTYLENSIMISQSPIHDVMWKRIKWAAKDSIRRNFEKCLNNPGGTIEYVGPLLLSKFWIRWVMPLRYIKNKTKIYEVLAYEHFASIENEVSFARHYQTSMWNIENH